MSVSRHYTQEVGIPDNRKRLSRPVAFAILALVAVGVSFGVAGVISETKEHHRAEKAANTPPPAPPPPVTEPAASEVSKPEPAK